MGCGSSTTTTTSSNSYPRQSNIPNRNNLYSDNDPTDDIPPDVSQPGRAKPKPGPAGATSEEHDLPKPPPPEPTPTEKETEDKVSGIFQI